MLVDKNEWEKIVSEMGISKNDKIIIYDNSDVISSCRCWFNFIYFGHDPKLVSILNGVLQKWIKEKREVTNVDAIEITSTWSGCVDLPIEQIWGCTDSTACTYNPDANVADESCLYFGAQQIKNPPPPAPIILVQSEPAFSDSSINSISNGSFLSSLRDNLISLHSLVKKAFSCISDSLPIASIPF